MFISKFRGGKSQHDAFQIEPLEQRRLLSAAGWLDGTANTQVSSASSGNDLLGDWIGDSNYDGSVNALDFNLLASNFGSVSQPPITTLATKLLKLEGQFAGHYTAATGTHALTFDITHCTHTGHFTGTCEFTNDAGKFAANVTGVIRSNKHVDLSYSGDGFSGSMTGIASHTGGSFSGDYENATGPVSSGTYHVAKA